MPPPLRPATRAIPRVSSSAAPASCWAATLARTSASFSTPTIPNSALPPRTCPRALSFRTHGSNTRWTTTSRSRAVKCCCPARARTCSLRSPSTPSITAPSPPSASPGCRNPHFAILQVIFEEVASGLHTHIAKCGFLQTGDADGGDGAVIEGVEGERRLQVLARAGQQHFTAREREVVLHLVFHPGVLNDKARGQVLGGKAEFGIVSVEKEADIRTEVATHQEAGAAELETLGIALE